MVIPTVIRGLGGHGVGGLCSARGHKSVALRPPAVRAGSAAEGAGGLRSVCTALHCTALHCRLCSQGGEGSLACRGSRS